MNNDIQNNINPTPVNPGVVNPEPVAPAVSSVETPVVPVQEPVAPVQPVAEPLPVQEPVAPAPVAEPVQEPVVPTPAPAVETPVEQPAEPTINPTVTVVPQIAPANEVPATPKKSNKGLLIGIIVAVLVVAFGIGAYFLFFKETPYTYYQKQVESIVSLAFENVHNDKIFNSEATMSMNIDSPQIPDNYKDLINNLKLSGVFQLDKENRKIVIKIDSKYQDGEFLKSDAYLDLNKKELYLYLGSIYDNFLRIDLSKEEYASLIDTKRFDELVNKQYDFEVIEKVLKDEFKKLITNGDCSKDGDFYVLKISGAELTKRLNNLISNLKSNSEFVKALGGQEEADAVLDGFIFGTLGDFEQELIIKSNKSKTIVTLGTTTLNIAVGDKKYDIEVSDHGESLFTVSINYSGNPEHRAVSLTFKSPQIGSISLDFDVKYSSIAGVDEVDQSRVHRYEDMSEEELLTIQNNLKNSLFYTTFDSLFSFDQANITF